MYILQIHIMQFMSEKKMKRTKFIYSEKATKFYEISTLLLTTVHTVKCKVKISKNFLGFSEYMNFNKKCFTAVTLKKNKLCITLIISTYNH